MISTLVYNVQPLPPDYIDIRLSVDEAAVLYDFIGRTTVVMVAPIAVAEFDKLLSEALTGK
jgi:hypothetical protein